MSRRCAIAGIDSYTKLLLHCNGTDGSTSFPDSSGTGKVVTATGNAQIDTAQSKFGGASALFDGTGDYLSLADSSDWDFGTNDFTIDLCVRFAGYKANGEDPLIDVGRYDTGILLRGYNTHTSLQVIIKTAGYTFNWNYSLNTWYHVAVVRNGTNLKAFINGTQIGSTLIDSTNIQTSLGVYVGSQIHAPADCLNGWIDEVRISKGIARWTANFTPPIYAYNSTRGILQFI